AALRAAQVTPARCAATRSKTRNNSHTVARSAGHSCAPHSQQNKTNNTTHSLRAAQEPEAAEKNAVSMQKLDKLELN
ncbi:hypothetical protein A2U01_0089423, partial [Trifolium medium]|nr:hypothetical protein [Trifolium medium]